jgi:hypothetical protein
MQSGWTAKPPEYVTGPFRSPIPLAINDTGGGSGTEAPHRPAGVAHQTATDKATPSAQSETGLRDNRVAVILLTETPHDLDLSTLVQGGGVGWDGLVVAEKAR